MTGSRETGSRWVAKPEYGFLGPEPESFKQAYGKALLICANGDGLLTENERAWVYWA